MCDEVSLYQTGELFFSSEWFALPLINLPDALLIYKPAINASIIGWHLHEAECKGNRSFLILK